MNEEKRTKIKVPDAAIMIEGLRSIGYSFATAVADVIDNSIAAYAKEVRIFYDASSQENAFFAICDDGIGMSADELDRAMDFGTKKNRTFADKRDLGRFGLGLKTASLSQCTRFKVITKKFGMVFGDEWDFELVAKTGKWEMIQLSEKAIEDTPFIEYLKDKESGTMVVWENFDKIKSSSKNFSTTFNRLVQNDVKNHCALVFHRFYGTMPIYINNEKLPKRDPFLEEFDNCISRESVSIPLNDVKTSEPIRVKAYRMPAESDLSLEEQELIGGSATLRAEEGLYIYRNDRLIAWGSWMRLEHKTLYTHLARIKIDIPASMDKEWSLDVKKSMAIIPDRIKDKLLGPIRDGIAQSTSRTRYVGQREETKTIERVWIRTVLPDHQVKYELNDQNLVYSSLRESLNHEQKRMLEAYLSDVQKYIPASRMRDDVNDDLQVTNGVTKEDNGDLAIRKMVDLLISLNVTDKEKANELIILLVHQEQFHSLVDKVDLVLKEFLHANGSK